MKSIIYTICLVFIIVNVNGQKSFDSKYKSQTKKPVLTDEFQSINGAVNQGFQGRMHSLVDTPIRQNLKYKVIKDPESEAIIYIENLEKSASGQNLRKSAKAQAFEFMTALKLQTRLKNVESELEILDTQFDEKGNKHSKIQQMYKGIPIYGAEMMLHATETQVKTVNGRIWPSPEGLAVKAKISEKKAIEKALEYLGDKTIVNERAHNDLGIGHLGNTSELLIYPKDGAFKLAYEIVARPNTLERWVIFLDATTAEVIDSYNHTCTFDGFFNTKAKDLNGFTRDFSIIQKGTSYFMVDASKDMFDSQRSQLPNSPVGAIWTLDALDSRIDQEIRPSHVISNDGITWSPTAVSAHYNASICYDYYKSKFGRTSLNGKGGTIVSVINITDEDGKGMDNAFWNGEFMGYGNGNQGFKPLAGALDVAGHEMTHGVIENTARLEYRNQSGALNESFADIFATLIDREDWTLGEDVVKSNVFPSGALRSLENPNQGGQRDPGYQPKNMSQYVYLRDVPSEDNGGVHINSGIPNHAFYLFATGAGMNRDKAERVYYHALSNYMTRTSRFVDLRLAIIQSTKDLYGSGQELSAATSAFDQVGILDPGSGQQVPNETEQVIEVNPGEQFVIVYEPGSGNLYRVQIGGDGFDVISEGFGCKKKPSITDDGTELFFVGDNSRIYYVDLTVSPTTPQEVSQDATWDNVAISKDGKLLAALTTSQDARIYVFNLESNQQASFELYNPTYTEGVSTGEVLFADSFEWDYSGEYLIYDAFNRVQGIFGDLDYWDVGVLRAWDVSSNSFGDGQIQKIFTDLDDGDNIGNPTISKTNPNILAFDYLDSNSDQFYILGLNLNTGDLNLITENNTIGFPDYTISDSHLGYTAIGSVGEVVVTIPLNADKISAAGNSSRLFEGGEDKLAVFYAQGVRKLPTKKNQEIQFSSVGSQNAGAVINLSASSNSGLPVQFSLLQGDATLNGSRITLGTTPGKIVVQAYQVGNSEFISASTEQSFCLNPRAPSISSNEDVLTVSTSGVFQWFVNGNAIGGQTTNRQITANRNGDWSVKAVTDDGCSSGFSNSINILKVLSTEPIQESRISVYPNPTQEVVRIKMLAGQQFQSAELTSLSGKEILKSNVPEINISRLSSGTYLIKVKTDKGDEVQKFVKN